MIIKQFLSAPKRPAVIISKSKITSLKNKIITVIQAPPQILGSITQITT
jgi:hypothetical protein